MRTKTDAEIAAVQVCVTGQHFYKVEKLESGKRIFLCVRSGCSATKPFTLPATPVSVINVAAEAGNLSRALGDS